MKSKSFKKIIEALPMKYGETLADVKTKVNLSHVPDELTTNTDSDVLFVLLNKNTGEYLGNMKINYLENTKVIFGTKTKSKYRTAYLSISELSQTIDDKAYISAINGLCFAQGHFGKFADYIQIQKNTLSERMELLIEKTLFENVENNPNIYEICIDNFLALFIIIIVMVFCL